jgi:hypothetical protein
LAQLHLLSELPLLRFLYIFLSTVMLTRIARDFAARQKCSATTSRALFLRPSNQAASTGLIHRVNTTENKNDSGKVSKDPVPVVTFEQGERKKRMLSVDATPTPSSSQDAQYHPIPFDGSVMHNLTPTITKFTLTGKYAIVSG